MLFHLPATCHNICIKMKPLSTRSAYITGIKMNPLSTGSACITGIKMNPLSDGSAYISGIKMNPLSAGSAYITSCYQLLLRQKKKSEPMALKQSHKTRPLQGIPPCSVCARWIPSLTSLYGRGSMAKQLGGQSLEAGIMPSFI